MLVVLARAVITHVYHTLLPDIWVSDWGLTEYYNTPFEKSNKLGCARFFVRDTSAPP